MAGFSAWPPAARPAPADGCWGSTGADWGAPVLSRMALKVILGSWQLLNVNELISFTLKPGVGQGIANWLVADRWR